MQHDADMAAAAVAESPSMGVHAGGIPPSPPPPQCAPCRFVQVHGRGRYEECPHPSSVRRRPAARGHTSTQRPVVWLGRMHCAQAPRMGILLLVAGPSPSYQGPTQPCGKTGKVKGGIAICARQPPPSSQRRPMSNEKGWRQIRHVRGRSCVEKKTYVVPPARDGKAIARVALQRSKHIGTRCGRTVSRIRRARDPPPPPPDTSPRPYSHEHMSLTLFLLHRRLIDARKRVRNLCSGL